MITILGLLLLGTLLLLALSDIDHSDDEWY